MIDILVAVYNGEKYLKYQLDSLLSQSYKDIHIIIFFIRIFFSISSPPPISILYAEA